MPARFFFDIKDGQDIVRDEIGVEAADLDEALAEAQSVIAEMAGNIRRSSPEEALFLVVRNEKGDPVGRLIIR